MTAHRFGANFPRLFAAAILQELSFAVLIHFPGYLTDLGATEGTIGLLYSTSALVSLLFRPWLGRILDLTHRRTVLLVTHDPLEALRLSHSIHVMKGRPAHLGEAIEPRRPPPRQVDDHDVLEHQGELLRQLAEAAS